MAVEARSGVVVVINDESCSPSLGCSMGRVAGRDANRHLRRSPRPDADAVFCCQNRHLRRSPRPDADAVFCCQNRHRRRGILLSICGRHATCQAFCQCRLVPPSFSLLLCLHPFLALHYRRRNKRRNHGAIPFSPYPHPVREKGEEGSTTHTYNLLCETRTRVPNCLS
jgi:hypothetical protein